MSDRNINYCFKEICSTALPAWEPFINMGWQCVTSWLQTIASNFEDVWLIDNLSMHENHNWVIVVMYRSYLIKLSLSSFYTRLLYSVCVCWQINVTLAKWNVQDIWQLILQTPDYCSLGPKKYRLNHHIYINGVFIFLNFLSVCHYCRPNNSILIIFKTAGKNSTKIWFNNRLVSYYSGKLLLFSKKLFPLRMR